MGGGGATVRDSAVAAVYRSLRSPALLQIVPPASGGRPHFRLHVVQIKCKEFPVYFFLYNRYCQEIKFGRGGEKEI